MALSAVPSPSPSADLRDPWLRSYFVSRLGALDRERASWVPAWRDLADHFAPRRGRLLPGAPDAARGKRKDQRIIDNTPLIAARVMASGMMAGISSPARPWFRLRLASERANQDPAARAWLDAVQQRMLRVFARSNLYNCLHTLYGELGVFGTAALWVDEDEEDVVRGYTLTIGEYWLASSARLAVDTLYRSMWWTVRQIVDTFGRDRVSPAIRSAYETGQLDGEHEIVQAIEPNPNAAGPAIGGARTPWSGHVAARLPWRSVWFERAAQGDNLLLRVSGYQEFPCMAPRWEVVGSDSWGSGPGWVALGDSQQLQTQQKRKLEAIDKQGQAAAGRPAVAQERAGEPAAGRRDLRRRSERPELPAGNRRAARPRRARRRHRRGPGPHQGGVLRQPVPDAGRPGKPRRTQIHRRQVTRHFNWNGRREEKSLMLGPRPHACPPLQFHLG